MLGCARGRIGGALAFNLPFDRFFFGAHRPCVICHSERLGAATKRKESGEKSPDSNSFAQRRIKRGRSIAATSISRTSATELCLRIYRLAFFHACIST